MFSRVGIVRGQAPLSIDISLLPDLVEKLPDAGFIAEMPFGIIVRNNETCGICSADAASAVGALPADGDYGRHREGESRLDGSRRSVAV